MQRTTRNLILDLATLVISGAQHRSIGGNVTLRERSGTLPGHWQPVIYHTVEEDESE